MEKSMVHELNPLVASNVQYSRASFIHTIYQTDFNQLRKSRIQNLPNYKKQDLSSKLNFVVVFQGIEIQRLSVQIQTLRVKVKDYQRQICNYQNYQVQIRQLTEKCHSYEMQRQDHQQAMQKMHKICQQLYNQLEEMRARYADIDLSLKQKYRLEKQRCQSLQHELQKWKARYSASETSKAKQLEDMRMMLQSQRKSMLQRQIRQISVKHQSERSMLQNQLRKLRENLQNKNAEIQRMRFQLDQGQVRQGQLRQYQSRLDQYEDKLMMMAQQNMRLNQLLRMKKEQIQTLKNNQRNLQSRLVNFKKIEEEFNQVNRRIQNYDAEIRGWNQKYSRLEAENARNQILSNKAQQYERLLDNSAEQMEKMNTIIREKISEIQKWKSQNQKLTIQLDQSKSIQSRILEYEETISQIANQNQRLSDLLRNRLEQVQSWKSKYAQIQLKLPLLMQSQNECKNLRDKLTDQVNTRAKMSQTISILQQDLSKAAQIQQSLIKQRNLNKDLQREIQRLNGSIKNLSNQNSDYTKKIQSLQSQVRENTGIIEQLNQCKRKINLMTQQLDRINGLIHQKIQQIKKLRENYNSVSINTVRYRQIQEQFVANLQQTQQLVLKLDQSRRQNQCAQQKLISVQSRCNRLQSQIFTNNEQKQKLIQIINQKRLQLEDLVGRLQKADRKLSVLQQLQQEFKAFKTNYAQQQQRFRQLQVRYGKQSKRSEEFSNQVQSLSTQLMKLKSQSNFSKQFVSQFASLKFQSQQKDKMILSLLQKVAIIQKCIAMLKQQTSKNYNGMCQQQTKWTNLSTNFEVVSGFMNKFFQLQVEIQKLAQENLKLQGSVNLMNFQIAQSAYAVQNATQETRRYQDGQSPTRFEPRISVRSPLQQKNKTQVAKTSSPTHSRERNTERTFQSSSTLLSNQQDQDNTQMPIPNTKLLSTDQDNTTKNNPTDYSYRYESIANTRPPSSNQAVGQNYYQSQVRELYGGNSYQPTSYSNLQGGYGQRLNQGNGVTYTKKLIRPGSQETMTTYNAYNNSYNNNMNGNIRPVSYGSEVFQGINTVHGNNLGQLNETEQMNYRFSNLSNAQRPGNVSTFQRPVSSVRQHSKHSISQVRTSPLIKDETNYQYTDGRKHVVSPVRFFN